MNEVKVMLVLTASAWGSPRRSHWHMVERERNWIAGSVPNSHDDDEVAARICTDDEFTWGWSVWAPYVYDPIEEGEADSEEFAMAAADAALERYAGCPAKDGSYPVSFYGFDVMMSHKE